MSAPTHLNQSQTSQLCLDVSSATASNSSVDLFSPTSTLLTPRCTPYEDSILLKHGYHNIKKISNTDEYTLFEAETSNNHCTNAKVMIKKAHKPLICRSTEGLCKEALILYHLTVSNTSTADSLVQYIDFIESNDNYYLIMEYVNTESTLAAFVKKAHRYIESGALAQKEYHKIIKHIFWQIFAVIHWLHNDMHCTHSQFSLQNIILSNAEFIHNTNDESVSLNPGIFPKIFDFSAAQLFKVAMNHSSNPLQCSKKTDIIALGTMLLQCVIGLDQPSISCISDLETYECISNKKLLHLLNNLCFEELKRFQITDVLKHKFFRSYYEKYKARIVSKSRAQKLRLRQQNLKGLPYYNRGQKVKHCFL